MIRFRGKPKGSASAEAPYGTMKDRTHELALFAFISSLVLLAIAGAARPGLSAGQNASQPAPYHKTDPLNSPGSPAMPFRPVTTPARSKRALLVGIRILPASISLVSPRFTQRLVVEGTFADGHQEDLTSKARLSSSDLRIALVDQQAFAHPQSDGRATVAATYEGRQASAPVEVRSFAAPFPWSFRNNVLPVMTKAGCNSGPCHGAAAGKSGFKLTLRGFDPETDYLTLTRQADARRTERMEPAHSLILLKPTLTLPHNGGQRFPVGSLEYQVIAGWIAAGMPPPKPTDPRIVGLEVLPREASLLPGARQQLLVTAKFSDGHSEDVTRWAKYSSADESVATVDDRGLVTMQGYGETPVTVWYLSRGTFARLRIPYPYAVDEAVFRRAPRNNYIDNFVLSHLKTLHIPPSRPTTDVELLRRAYLDAAGILPRPGEVEEFLRDSSPNKRARLIDQLIASPEFVDYWAYKWSDLLLVSSNKLSPDAMWAYSNWIRQGVARNKPWDQFVREIITASGNTLEYGAANYWVIHRLPIDIAENVTQAFLGINISCAHCHNHPLAEWTQKDYYGMANLFARVRLKMDKPAGNKPGVGAIFRDVTVYNGYTGQYTDDRFSRPLAPKPLEADSLPLDSPRDRREYFAEWLTSRENPYFARALVNRVWRNFMGRGLIEPVDDMRNTNPPTNEELLNALVKDFVGHGFDVNHLIRTIMNSATYQASSVANSYNVRDEKYDSHYLIRRLPAEVLLDALSQVTEVPEKFEGYPLGMRALQLPDTAVQNYFLTAFGRPPREQTRESERSSVPTITQALHAINGATLNDKLRAPGSVVDMLLKLGMADDQVVDYVFLAALSRHPRQGERRAIVENLTAEWRSAAAGSSADPRRAALEDLMWAVLTSKEFMFNY